MNKTTGELLNILKSKKDYNDFIKEEVSELCFSSVSEYLEFLITQKGLTKSGVIERSNMDKNYAYQIFNGNKTNPSRDKILMLSFGMGLTPEETKKLLKICGLGDLYVRVPRDSVLIYCLEKGKSLIEANIILDAHSLKILE